MIRQHFKGFKTFEKDKIKWRSHEPHRIEAFSDAVFAFAVSILIISLEVPHTAKELLEMMRGFVPFIFCFGLIFVIWYAQYKFFRQFGLHDTFTLVLNGALLFLVLFYVYPLKFMAALTVSTPSRPYTVAPEDSVPLLLLYNSGFAGIYILFTLMYWNALMKREELKLDPIEVFTTKTHLFVNIYIASVGILTTICSLLGGRIANIGMTCYGLLGGIGILSVIRVKKFHKKFGNAPIADPHLGTEG